jgi:hypothetical protein
MAATTKRKVIRVHRQAMGMLEIVRRHLDRFPEDSALFAIDFERALGDLGFDLTHGMREHLIKQFYTPDPKAGQLYDAVKDGHVTLPAQIRLTLGPAPVKGELTGVNPDGPGVPITRVVPPTESALSKAIRPAVPPEPGTGGYTVLLQLTPAVVNNIIGVAYDENLIPHDFNGSFHLAWQFLRMEIDADYQLEVQKPTIDFNTPYLNGVALNLAASAKLSLTFSYFDFPTGSLPSVTDTLEADVTLSARVVGTAEIRSVGSSKGAVYLNLVALEALTVTVSGPSFPPLVQQLIQSTIERLIQTEIAGMQAPLSFSFNMQNRAGIQITALASQIRPPAGGNPGTLSIAVDTKKTPTGDPTKIPHIIPSGCEFACIATKDFIIGQVWPTVIQYIPKEESGFQISNPSLTMENYDLYFSVHAHKDITCLPGIDADVVVKAQFALVPPDQNGVQRARLNAISDSVSLSFFDQLFYTLLLGLLCGILGGPLAGLIAMVAVNVVIAVLEDIAEVNIKNSVNQSSIGFRDQIPGTNIIVEASTPQAPTIYADMIYGYGNAVFYPGH